MTTPLPYHLINAFAPTPHAGNQASVVVFPTADDPRANNEEFYRKTAADFNLSETAFLVPVDAGAKEPRYGLRWSTPAAEVPLCGHATLAAAYALFNYVHPEAKKLHFDTRWRGTLAATLESETGQGALVGLDFPVTDTPAVAELVSTVGAKVAAAAGLPADDVVGVGKFDFGVDAYVVEVKEGVAVKDLKVDSAALDGLGRAHQLARLCARRRHRRGPRGASCPPRLLSRVPLTTPQTGSAHTALIHYYLRTADASARVAALAGVPQADVEKVVLDAAQVSPRGGEIRAQIVDGRASLVGKGWRWGFGQLEVLPQ
ncbi:hypothetical protein VHUM_02791 [Vanrija humicola]|uniref:Phenazine biosynthesis protein n=1 Tax=Vanrija humicola TaxID=5417 RepID=A0A7D8Z2M9_VANHU|nr:hypothetical protein VHUM_02791 [Vanrija humicola]